MVAVHNEQSGAGYRGRVRLMDTSATEPEVRAMPATESHCLPALQAGYVRAWCVGSGQHCEQEQFEADVVRRAVAA
jgi:hypothetical protein